MAADHFHNTRRSSNPTVYFLSVSPLITLQEILQVHIDPEL